MKKIIPVFLVSALTFVFSCDNKEEVVPGKLTLHFSHLIEGEDIDFNQMIYTNAAGNPYEVTEIQWFISDITLISQKGEAYLLDKGGFAHYVDTKLPETHIWQLPDDIEPGSYSSLKITFGIKGEKNIPNSFPNPPESNMIWPYHMGGDYGGYHYMKLNGFWNNTEGERTPFNFHVGVGQEYDSEENVTGFIQNWFEATLPNSSFILKPGETKKIYLKMNVESWFDTPNVYDHNVYGSMIMTNQEAMGKIKENGTDVFSAEFDDEECTLCGTF